MVLPNQKSRAAIVALQGGNVTGGPVGGPSCYSGYNAYTTVPTIPGDNDDGDNGGGSVSTSFWNYACDFGNDAIPSYPSLKNANDTNITLSGLRRAHLFGWKGCSNEESNDTAKAYDGFFTLAQQLDVYNKIDRCSPAATDFWGPASGINVIPDGTLKEIQRKPAQSFQNVNDEVD